MQNILRGIWRRRIENSCRVARVESNEKTKRKEVVWNLTTDIRNFIANGIIVHNSVKTVEGWNEYVKHLGGRRIWDCNLPLCTYTKIKEYFPAELEQNPELRKIDPFEIGISTMERIKRLRENG